MCSPAEPKLFTSVFEVLKLCNRISEGQGKQPVYGPKELLSTDTRAFSKGIDHGWGSEIEEIFDTITLNRAADGWRIPSEVEWEGACVLLEKSSEFNSNKRAVVGQNKLKKGLSDLEPPLVELCWGKGVPPFFEEMIHPIPKLVDPFSYGTDEEQRTLVGQWSTRGETQIPSRNPSQVFSVRLVRTLHSLGGV